MSSMSIAVSRAAVHLVHDSGDIDLSHIGTAWLRYLKVYTPLLEISRLDYRGSEYQYQTYRVQRRVASFSTGNAVTIFGKTAKMH
ncbi:hypothetical protein AC578_11001 [Pseudocercospora eumusae]|uniref:Uncharacterized protein n=1 Tax=Pseudocercospora eumusae TaxID=321146 RepID=A0A139HSB1_9PEZI|nr:hypothetical protein AC578_11001 [Pseudocercospora eumusae]